MTTTIGVSGRALLETKASCSSTLTPWSCWAAIDLVSTMRTLGSQGNYISHRRRQLMAYRIESRLSFFPHILDRVFPCSLSVTFSVCQTSCKEYSFLIIIFGLYLSLSKVIRVSGILDASRSQLTIGCRVIWPTVEAIFRILGESGTEGYIWLPADDLGASGSGDPRRFPELVFSGILWIGSPQSQGSTSSSRSINKGLSIFSPINYHGLNLKLELLLCYVLLPHSLWLGNDKWEHETRWLCIGFDRNYIYT